MKEPDIFGRAIQDLYYKGTAADIHVHAEDFDDDVIPVEYLFRNYAEMPPVERRALELCRGSVLDVGCGVGSHALYLQDERKLQVTAIDTSEGAVEVCRERGIREVQQISFEDFQGRQFDTLLFLMNGTGIIGSLGRLPEFFNKLRELLVPDGQVLIDSSDLIYLFDADEDGGVWVDPDQYYGELTYQVSYKGKISAKFPWLYLDFDSLYLAAEDSGFSCELVQKGEHYEYLARLRKRI